MVEWYSNLITSICAGRHLGVVFFINDGKLYVYNFYLLKENQKILEVFKINDVLVKDIINDFKDEDFYNKEKLLKYGIDVSKGFVLTLKDENKFFDFDVLDECVSDNFFYKEHEKNPILSNESLNTFNYTRPIENIMLEYSSTAVKALIKILNDMAISQSDKDKLGEFLDNLSFVSNNYNNVFSNMDMIFLSTQLLMLNLNDDYLPDYILYKVERMIPCYNFIDDSFIRENSTIMDGDKIIPLKVIRMIRNAIAHSNYKIHSDEIVELYDIGRGNCLKFHLFVLKEMLFNLFNLIYDYYFFKGAFPKMFHGNTNYLNLKPLSEDDIEDFLKSIVLIGAREKEASSALKKAENLEQESHMGFTVSDCLGLLDGHDLYAYVGKYDFYLNLCKKINKCIEKPLDVRKSNLTDEDINYIIQNINQMDKNYFYNLDKSTQLQVIDFLIHKRYNKKYYLKSNLKNMIGKNNFNNDYLGNKAYDYINYSSKMELLIISFMNVLFLYCYNQNRSTIQAQNVRFPVKVYEDFLKIKVGFYAENVKTIINYMPLIADENLSNLTSFELNDIRNNINKCRNKMIKFYNEANRLKAILDGTADDNVYNAVNVEILKNIRHCLAHGHLKIDNIDIYDLMNTKLQITDEFDGQIHFETTVTLGELIESANNLDLINSLLNENRNFLRHTI